MKFVATRWRTMDTLLYLTTTFFVILLVCFKSTVAIPVSVTVVEASGTAAPVWDHQNIYNQTYFERIRNRKQQRRRTKTITDESTVQQQQQQQLNNNNIYDNRYSNSCRLYLAPKLMNGTKVLTFYSGIDHPAFEKPLLGTSTDELIISIHNAMREQYSPWHAYVWPSETFYYNGNIEYDIWISGGIGTLLQCPEQDDDHEPNVDTTIQTDYIEDVEHNTFIVSSIRDIQIGEELRLDCIEDDSSVKTTSSKKASGNNNQNIVSMEFLQKEGICIDANNAFDVRLSTIDNAGKGLFAKQTFQKDEIITISPVIQFDRSHMDIIDDHVLNHGDYDSSVFEPTSSTDVLKNKPIDETGFHSFINYCYGHVHSNVLLLPYAPGVNYINHPSDDNEPNVYITWSNHPLFEKVQLMEGNNNIKKVLPEKTLLETYSIRLAFEYKALRQINPGDELFIDYGMEWWNTFNNDFEKKQIAASENEGGQQTIEHLFIHEIQVPDTFFPDQWKYDDTCRLYIAPKYNNVQDGLFLYSGIKHKASNEPLFGTSVDELVLRIPKGMIKEYSQLDYFLWPGQVYLPYDKDSEYYELWIGGGIGTLLQCRENIEPNIQTYMVSAWDYIDDLLENPEPIRDSYVVTPMSDIQAGEELVLDCARTETKSKLLSETEIKKTVAPLKYLKQNGICFDGHRKVDIQSSTIPEAGKGLFAHRSFHKDEIIITSPVIQLDRKNIDFKMQFTRSSSSHEATNKNTTLKTENLSLLNYCYGHKHSNVLLLPYAPDVHYINHPLPNHQPNIYIDWSRHSMFGNVDEIDDPFDNILLGIEYKALRDIGPGEELFLDYGNNWWAAYTEYNNKQILNADIRSEKEEFQHAIQVSDDFFPNEWKFFDGDVEDACRLYLAPKINSAENILTLYSGIAHSELENPLIGTSINELVVTIRHAMRNEYSPWHSYAWTSSNFLEDDDEFSKLWISGGIGTLLQCSDDEHDSDPNVITYIQRHDGIGTEQFAVSSIRNIHVGEELILNCRSNNTEQSSLYHTIIKKNVASLEYLQQNGICFDADRIFDVRQSTIPNAGKGLFAKKDLKKDEIIAISPVIAFDRSQMNIVQQYQPSDIGYDHSLPNFRSDSQTTQYRASQVLGHYSLINYCFGNNNSNVLLLPYAPGINYLNHPSSNQEPNVYISWSKNTIFKQAEYKNVASFRSALSTMELFESSNISLGFEYRALRYIQPGEELFINYGVDWSNAYKELSIHYENNIKQVQQNFRHEINVQDEFFPDHWMRYNTQQATILNQGKPADIVTNPLKNGYIAPIRWSATHDIVSPWTFRIGLTSRIREVLLEYCHRVGIKKLLQHVTMEGNGLIVNDRQYVSFQTNRSKTNEQKWYIQRHNSEGKSNLHWLSPGDRNAQESLLQALSFAGFDDILQSIGEYFSFNGLAIYHTTFSAISHSTKGYHHWDMRDTGAGVYNIIVPLIIPNETDPELEIKNDHGSQNTKKARYFYEHDVGVMIGDKSHHETNAVDYRYNREMRLTASIYVADINNQNIRTIAQDSMIDYLGYDPKLLLTWAGRHWSSTDSFKKLPKSDPNHILFEKGMNDNYVTTARKT